MSKADRRFIEMCSEIILNGEDSTGQNVRPKWEDGTPAHTTSIFKYVSSYDLSEEFPIQTLRPVNLKAAFDEILWIFQKKSNDISELNSSIWNQWAVSEVSDKLVYIVAAQSAADISSNKNHPVAAEIIDMTLPVMKTNNFGEFYVVKKSGKMWTIQFKDTGYICTVNRDASNIALTRDPYRRSVCGVGFYGNYHSDDIVQYFGDLLNNWVDIWRAMVKRCNGKYSGKSKCYDDVTLHCDFESCEQFLRWVMENNRFGREHLHEMQIDKDYFGGAEYGPNTCVLLTSKENHALYAARWYLVSGKLFTSKYDLVEYSGESSLVLSSGRINEFRFEQYVENQVRSGDLVVIDPRLRSADGLLPRFSLLPKMTIAKSYGYQMRKQYNFPQGCMDQVDNVLWLLKNDPYSRRIMWSMYNPNDILQKPLQECAYECIFSVKKGHLDMMLIQRSQDSLVAFAWNECQYAALQLMIAQSVGLKPGIFTHVIGDAHIYDRHIPLVKDLIQREQYDAPKVWLNPYVSDFYAFTIDDLHIQNYKYNDQIKNIPVAV